MIGQGGNIRVQSDRGQPPLRPPYQQHAPGHGLFPPHAQTPLQPPLAPLAAVSQAPAYSSHVGQPDRPVYEHRMAPNPTAHHLAPLQAPARPLSNAAPTNQSFVVPLQRPLIPRSMAMSSTNLNVQQSSHHPSHIGNQMSHPSLAPHGRPPLPDISRNLPPLRLPPPPMQGHSMYRPSPSPQTVPRGSLIHSIPQENQVLPAASLVPPPPSSSASSMPFPALPPVQLPSSSASQTFSKLQQQFTSEEETDKFRGSGITGWNSYHDRSGPTEMRSDAPIINEIKRSDNRSDCRLNYAVGSGPSMDTTLSINGPQAPSKPTEEKVIQKIEVLCQFIARNGPGFEDMARKRESCNPEFKFLFGGEPGSEAAIAHDYFQWLKKRYCSTGRLHERQNYLAASHSEVCSPRQPDRLMHVATSDVDADSDMEMEDDMSQPPKDEQTSSLVPGLHVVQDSVNSAVSASVSSDKFRSSGDATFGDQGEGSVVLSHQSQSIQINTLREVDSDNDLPEASILPSSGIEDKRIITSVVETVDLGKNSDEDVKVPLKVLQEYCPNVGIENNDTSHSGEHIDMVMQSAGGISVSENIGNGTGPEISSKIDKDAGKMFQSTPTDQVMMSSLHSESKLRENGATSSGKGGINQLGDHNLNKEPAEVSSLEPLDRKGSPRNPVDYKNESPKTRKENKDHHFESVPTVVKVDEFGRLVREGVSDSDSDESHHSCQHNTRARNRSRSASPGSRRKGISGHKREIQSHSRGWSPRRWRSRSRSPKRRRSRSRSPRRRRSRSPVRHKSRSRSPFRHASEFRNGSLRKDRGRKQECFYFLQGKCYRGASCRYSHHDGEIDGSTRKLKNTDVQSVEQTDANKGVFKQVDEETKELALQHSSNTLQKSFDIMGGQKMEERTALVHVGYREADQSQRITAQDEVNTHRIPGTASFKSEEKIHSNFSIASHQPISGVAAVMIHSKNLDIRSSTMGFIEPSQVNTDVVASANAPPHSLDSSSSLRLPSDKNSASSSAVTSYDITNGQTFLRDLNSASRVSYPFQPTSQDIASTMLPNPLPHFFSGLPLPNNTLTSMAAADVTGRTATHDGAVVRDGPSATHGGYLHVPHSNSLHSQSLLKQFPSLMQPEDLRLGSSPAGAPPSDGNVGPSLAKEVLNTNMYPFHASKMSTTGPSRAAQGQSCLQLSGLQNKGDISNQDVPQNLPEDLRGMTQSSSVPDYGGSTVTSQYASYGSTFELPVVSNPSADTLTQDYRGQYNNGLDVLDGGSVKVSSPVKSVAGIQQSFAQSEGDQYDPLLDSIEISSNSIKKAGQAPEQGSLYDSNAMMSMSGSNKPMDVEENNQKKESEAFIPSTSVDDDGFGETADADVGDFENLSPTNTIEEANDLVGEAEIDQVNSPEKSKQHKETKSMKLFKIALANFVKEVLRPSWRQGNMSKEAFKTIVKKTVDKVTGAMKSHHIPKSQSKINHYIDSSEQKLTKLVMGYVDKYVKV